jgi:hypothetical protein
LAVVFCPLLIKFILMNGLLRQRVRFTRGWAAVIVAPALLLVPAQGFALSLENNPYKVITDRNAFGLKSPAPPPLPPAAPVEKPINIKLTGISRIGNVTRAHLMVEDPKQPGQQLFMNLADDPNKDNTKQGAVEVLEINQAKETVRIRNGGNEVTLNFKDNGNTTKGPPNPVAGVMPPGGAPPVNTAVVSSGGSSAPIVVSSRGGSNPAPASNVMVSSSPGAAADVYARAADAYARGGQGNTATPAMRSIPTRTVRTAPAAGSDSIAAPQLPQNRISAEEQQLIMEATRIRESKFGRDLPPTPGLPTTTIEAPQVPQLPR